VFEVVGDGNRDIWPTSEQLKKLTYLSKVIKEVSNYFLVAATW